MNVLFRLMKIKQTQWYKDWTDQPFNLEGDNGTEHKDDPEDGAHYKSEPEDPWLSTGRCV